MTDSKLRSKHYIAHNKHTESHTPTATSTCVRECTLHDRPAQSHGAVAATVSVKKLLVIKRC
jgi:hypothetical protein